jgi:hypothetical protein
VKAVKESVIVVLAGCHHFNCPRSGHQLAHNLARGDQLVGQRRGVRKPCGPFHHAESINLASHVSPIPP